MILYRKGGKLHGNAKPPEWLQPHMTSSTRFNKGRYYDLEGCPAPGCSMGADADGFFIYTHRARSKSRPDLNFTQKEKDFIKSTG